MAYVAATSLIASVLSAVGPAPAHASPIALPSLVDDGVYPYPDAAAILAEQNVELISGDGHIVLADCTTPPVGDIGLVKVYTTDEAIGAGEIGRVCFKVLASSGTLNLRVPGVYEIRGDGQRTGTGHEVTAELEDGTGEEITVEVDPDGSTPVGLGGDPTASPTMLLQLRVGPAAAPVTGSQTPVGKIASADRMCTATLVTPSWVLSAASCFAADPNQPQLAESAPAGPTHVAFPGHAAVAVNLLIPRWGRDVMLARLATPITGITPLALADTAAPTGTALTAVGYGRDTEWTTDQQQSPQITFTGSTPNTLTAGSGPLVCAGMAGAPVLDAGKVAAVLSQAGQAGCLGVTATDTSVTAARIDDLAAWFSAITTNTADHSWTLAGMPNGAISGSPVTTTVADTGNAPTAVPMTATSGATWTTGGTYSPAIEFNGTNGLLKANGPAVSTNADFTLSAWVKPNAGGGTVLSQDGSAIRGVNASPGFRLAVNGSDNSWSFSMAHGPQLSTGWDFAHTAPGTAPTGVWSHVVVTYNAARRVAIVYVDGVNLGSLTHATPWNASGPFRVGAWFMGETVTAGFFNGQVSQVQTWNSVTTQPTKVEHDLNGDGWPDLAAADTSGNLWLYPGTSGTGLDTLASGPGTGGPGGDTATRVQIKTGFTGYRWSISDWDVDGLADLLTIDASGNLDFHKNLGLFGTATLAAPVRLSAGWTNYLFGVGNADTDPHPDHVGIATATGKMYFYPQGTGKIEVKAAGFGANYRVYVADFNDDSRGDVITINPSGIMHLHANTGGTGLAMFGTAAQIGTGWSPFKATVFDLSHDGKPDVIAQGSDGNVWLYGHTASGWVGPTKIATGWNTANITSIG
ncbi:LamG-like jellyroll fold domain-containing protein [Catellatospora sichuanensis]|uniref:LamG-like jellyroll fold domain-containing protein n=1 Tax=Catellatospora sichuanensis TaxID=1969805 RepID=UPI001FE48FC9|nr:LamG-like jellyroll fold domain-containing protein [Catellatospora sichuanensis]